MSNRVSIDGEHILLNDEPVKIIGLRCSNALIDDASAQLLIDNLDTFKSYGLNTVSVFLMGSRFGDVKGYRPDASLDPQYAGRLDTIIREADSRRMIVLIGCLYWGNSRAKEDLSHWTQSEVNLAVANTVTWLWDNGHRNVIVDPDNEGMSPFDVGQMIDAGHEADPESIIGFNERSEPPANADLTFHFGAKVPVKPWFQSEGTPHNTPTEGGYWRHWCKEGGYYNYIRIGRYTEAMKTHEKEESRRDIDEYNGYMKASTWIQCGPGEGIGGPFMTPGGRSEESNAPEDVKALAPDAGVLWWLEWVQNTYGEWS